MERTDSEINTPEDLKVRLGSHKKYSKKEINDWILANLPDLKDKIILDLGCGDGKQIFELIKHVGENGKIVGIDKNPDLIDEINTKKGSDSRIKAVVGTLENFEHLLNDEKVDIVISCFSIYYSTDPENTFSQIFNVLKDGGMAFIAGPTGGNSHELLKIHEGLVEIPKDFQKNIDFLTNKAIPFLKKNFTIENISFFQNKLAFPDLNSAMEYWKNGVLYNKEIEEKIKSRLQQHISQFNNFTITKQVMGVLVKKISDAPLGVFKGNPSNPAFTFSYFEKIIRKAKEGGFKFLTHKKFFENINSFKEEDKIILLRHDADFDIDKAFKLANLEHSLGVYGTYYFRVHAKYNLFSYKNYRYLQKMMEMGHEIGLHYEAVDMVNLFKGDMNEIFLREKKILETVLGQKIFGCAAHRDWITYTSNLELFNVHKLDISEVGLLYEAYDAEKHMIYVSEAYNKNGLTWRTSKNPEDLLEEVSKLCIMTHPRYWYVDHPFEVEY